MDDGRQSSRISPGVTMAAKTIHNLCGNREDGYLQSSPSFTLMKVTEVFNCLTLRFQNCLHVAVVLK